jgi:hypothetical protein
MKDCKVYGINEKITGLVQQHAFDKSTRNKMYGMHVRVLGDSKNIGCTFSPGNFE